MHTAAYDTSFEHKDKTVAVIGNGASGVQIVPAIQPGLTLPPPPLISVYMAISATLFLVRWDVYCRCKEVGSCGTKSNLDSASFWSKYPS